MTEAQVDVPVVGATRGVLVAPAPPEGDLAAASELMSASMAENTVRAYARDWRAWLAYATTHGLPEMPAEPAHVCAFLAAHDRDRKATTTQRAAMAIGKAHRLAGLPNPIDHEHVRRTLAGLRRTKGVAPRNATPLVTDDVE